MEMPWLPPLPPLISIPTSPVVTAVEVSSQFAPLVSFWLPPIMANLDHAPSPVANVTAAGAGSASAQHFAVPANSNVKAIHTGSGMPIHSDGDPQRKNMNPGQQGVTVTQAPGGIRTSNGQFQSKNLSPSDGAGVQHHGTEGLPVEVNVADYNPSKIIRSQAKALPIAVSVDAGLHRPGGLAVPVNIR